MLNRTARIQLLVFAVVTVATVGAISLFYLRVPARLGIGAYEITANFVAGGGLYENANVTFRGVQAGRVEAVKLTDDGVAAHMRLNSDIKIPANSTATVKSVSAIGEQYVDLVPPADPSQAVLRDGSTIPKERTALPQDIAELLHEADQLVSSLNNTRLQDLLRETFKAFNGSGPELARLIQSARLLIDEANASWPQTSALIDQVGPFLEAQIRSGDDIRSSAEGLARFTTEVANADPQVRDLLATTPGAAAEASETFAGIRPSFPVLAANLANFGRIGVIYHRSIEQALVIFPALQAALLTIGGQLPIDEGGKQDFKISINDPPPCNTGFLSPMDIRSPGDTTLRELPTDLYCKVAQNDPTVVRGARNYPCQEFPGKRAPTIQLCRDPQGYVPIGNSPWRGPPVPVGTPVTDPRNILPPNKFPYIPPEADPDPGYPVAPGLLPPGVQPGPGPAPHQPWPYIPPPNDNGPPPPATAWIPPAPYPDAWPPPANPQPPFMFPGPYNPVVPPPGPAPAPPPPPVPAELPPAAVNPPQASGAAYGTYDQHTGVFVDPAGGTGVYAPGAANMRPQESWLDLMLYPRQT
jgi:phospholipid/cholesterol/gamma-HCH transport system substrate-binding protein